MSGAAGHEPRAYEIVEITGRMALSLSLLGGEKGKGV